MTEQILFRSRLKIETPFLTNVLHSFVAQICNAKKNLLQIPQSQAFQVLLVSITDQSHLEASVLRLYVGLVFPITATILLYIAA